MQREREREREREIMAPILCPYPSLLQVVLLWLQVMILLKVMVALR